MSMERLDSFTRRSEVKPPIKVTLPDLSVQRHPEMVLGRDDFVSFVANWEPKPQNILKIADQLSLGASSFVFVDDKLGVSIVLVRLAVAVRRTHC